MFKRRAKILVFAVPGPIIAGIYIHIYIYIYIYIAENSSFNLFEKLSWKAFSNPALKQETSCFVEICRDQVLNEYFRMSFLQLNPGLPGLYQSSWSCTSWTSTQAHLWIWWRRSSVAERWAGGAKDPKLLRA